MRRFAVYVQTDSGGKHIAIVFGLQDALDVVVPLLSWLAKHFRLLQRTDDQTEALNGAKRVAAAAAEQ